MTPAEIHFGKQIKDARKARGLSQEELGFRAGIHASYVSQLERGIKSPTLHIMLRLGQALNKPASEMLRAVEAAL